jgi:hypothetical protein
MQTKLGKQIFYLGLVGGGVGTAFLLGGCQLLSRARPPETLPSGSPSVGQEQWQNFSPAGGRFSISVPAQPIQSKQVVNTAAGQLETQIYQVDRKIIAYTMMYVDYPASVVEQLEPQTMFNNARDYMLKSQNGQLLGERNVALGDYPGRELKVKFPNGILAIARMYLVKGRLYQTIVTAKPGLDTTANVNRFLDSMKLN